MNVLCQEINALKQKLVLKYESGNYSKSGGRNKEEIEGLMKWTSKLNRYNKIEPEMEGYGKMMLTPRAHKNSEKTLGGGAHEYQGREEANSIITIRRRYIIS